MLTLAKNYLIFSHQRIHPEDGKNQGPSLLIDELNHYLVKRGVSSGMMKIDHPTFPFDRHYFSPEAKVKKWSQTEFLAAKAHYFPQPIDSHFFHFKPFDPPSPLEISIDIRQLKKLARNPLQFYFNETLKIYLNEEEDDEEMEFIISHLRKAILRKKMIHAPVEHVMRQMSSQGKLPRGLFQEVAARELEEETEDLLKQLKGFGVRSDEIHAVRFSPALSIPISGSRVVHITGKLEDVTSKGLLAHVDNDLKGLVKVWPLYLIYRCLNPENRFLLLTKKGVQKEIPLEDPQAALASYLDYFFLAAQRPSLLMPQFAKALLEGGDEELKSALLKDDEDPYLKYLKRRRVSCEPKEALSLWRDPLYKVFSRLLRGGNNAL
jgi:exonuclease V gamma subunit